MDHTPNDFADLQGFGSAKGSTAALGGNVVSFSNARLKSLEKDMANLKQRQRELIRNGKNSTRQLQALFEVQRGLLLENSLDSVIAWALTQIPKSFDLIQASLALEVTQYEIPYVSHPHFRRLTPGSVFRLFTDRSLIMGTMASAEAVAVPCECKSFAISRICIGHKKRSGFLVLASATDEFSSSPSETEIVSALATSLQLSLSREYDRL